MKKSVLLYTLVGCCTLYSTSKASGCNKSDYKCICNNLKGEWDSTHNKCQKTPEYCAKSNGNGSEFLPSLDICSNPTDDNLTCQYLPADCWYWVCVDRHEGTQKAEGDYSSGSPLDIANKEGCCELKYGKGKWDDTNKKCKI